MVVANFEALRCSTRLWDDARMNERHPRSYPVDVARGFCLVIMTIDHMPRNILGRFSNVRFGPFGFFTGASGFVFLSGLVAAWVYGLVLRQEGPAAVWRRALWRAGELYVVNTTLLLFVFAGVSLRLLTGSQWQSEFQPLFAEPWTALCRGLLLLYRPGFLDILPMYVLFLMAVTPALRGIQAGHARGVLGLSALAWLWIQVLAPSRSNSLNPLGYQILFVSGLVAGSIPGLGARLRAARMQAVSRASLALTAVLFLFRLVLGVVKEAHPPVPGWDRLTHLENNGALRLVNFGLFALSTVWVWQRIPQRLKGGIFARWLAHLGQHSLQVFAWSVAATYVSLAVMPSSPSRAWTAIDMTLAVLSLVIPAQLHSRLRKRTGGYGWRPGVPNSSRINRP